MPRSLTHHLNHRAIISRSWPHERRNMRSVWPDRNNVITSITHSTSGSQIVKHSYTYDETNNIVEYLNSIDGATSYDYDYLGQLIGADYASQTDETYVYDSNGNRVTANGDIYTTGVNNELTSDGTYTYTYDAEGNRTSKTNTAGTERELYEWDYRNRLTTVTKQTYDTTTATWTTVQIVEYTYDYNNVWIRKTVGNSKTIFIPENYQTTVQIDNGTTTHHYLWTPNQQDKLLADTTTDGVLWSLTDHLGTVRDILSATETVHLIYDAFGNLISGTTPLLFGFTGKAFDSDTQLQNNINRWYDARVGRWLSTDPIGFYGNDTNLYRYVKNLILLKLDLYGLKDFWEHDRDSYLTAIGKEMRRKQRNDVLAKARRCLMNCINSNERCFDEREKDEAIVLFNQIIATAQNIPNDTLRNGCEKWAKDFTKSLSALPKSDVFDFETVVFDYVLSRWFNYIAFPQDPLRHVVIKVTICDRTAFYLDNGWWNHIFDEIPVSVDLSKPQTSIYPQILKGLKSSLPDGLGGVPLLFPY